jgi:DNA-binding CsgD family transcriptional regulator
MYRRLGPPAAWRPMPHVVTFCYSTGIQVANALDASDDVATLRDRLARYRGHHLANAGGTVAYGGPVEFYLGLAAGHLGELDDAVVELERATHVCALNGAAGFGLEALYELAAILARRAESRDLPRARTLAAESARQAAVLGMPPFAKKAGRLITQLDGDTATGLTRREREVAELVADGLTNREIAERLYLSERTSQNHVQHILTKLNLPNRSQIVWITTRK